MDILQLKYFYALSQTQHVTKTANQLHIAQPSLTQSIRRLENELEVKLFQASGRNIVLTEYGKYLQKKIEPVLKTLNEIPDEIKNLAGERKKLLKINVLAASTLITDTIIEFQKKYDDIRFQIVQHNEEENADITIFTEEKFYGSNNVKDRFYVFSEQIFLAVPKTSKYSSYKYIHLSEMAGKNFISLAGSKGLRLICDKFCMNAGFKPDVVFESDSTYAVKNLIGASMGVGFWPEYTWEKPDENKMSLIPISYPNCHRDIIIQLHNTALEHPIAVLYFEFLADYFDSFKK